MSDINEVVELIRKLDSAINLAERLDRLAGPLPGTEDDWEAWRTSVRTRLAAAREKHTALLNMPIKSPWGDIYRHKTYDVTIGGAYSPKRTLRNVRFQTAETEITQDQYFMGHLIYPKKPGSYGAARRMSGVYINNVVEHAE